MERKWRESLHGVSAYCDAIIQRTRWLSTYALSFCLQYPVYLVIGITNRSGDIACSEKLLYLVVAAKARPLDVKLVVRTAVLRWH
jgi:hypothetical protein